MWLLALCSCLPKGSYPLDAVESAEELSTGELRVKSTGSLERPGQTWELHLNLTVENTGKGQPWVDLARMTLRIDGLQWESCRRPTEVAQELGRRLEPGATETFEIVCRDVRRVDRQVEVRLPVAGGGTSRIDLTFGGVR